MAAKTKDFSTGLKRQLDQKITTQKEDTISELEKENKKLLEKIKDYEAKKDVSGTIKIDIDDIIPVSNIRDNLDYEEIESLAENIKELGQLQPVLLTKDNHLIAGYRRYNAIKLLGKNGPNYLYALKLENDYSEIDPQLFIKIQYSENENRKSLDNFHISKLFNDFLNNGKTQKEICEIFGKSKGFVSSLVTLKKIDNELVKYLKEFQLYGWSKKKFIAMNQGEELDLNKFYASNRGIIGWQPLYEIAKFDDISEQKTAFLKLYKNRLSEEESGSDYFKDLGQKNKNRDSKKRISVAIKSLKNLSEMLPDIKDNLSENEIKDFENAKKYLSKLENIFIKNSEKIK